MKKIFVICVVLLGTVSAFSQNVFIPDANFKAALLSDVIVNSNQDQEIQLIEVQNIFDLDIANKGISDLTGIESFSNLDVLDCSKNSLPVLSLKSNTGLSKLKCNSNKLMSLDLSSNKALESLYCNDNVLKELKIPVYLSVLDCSKNKLKRLDLQKYKGLSILKCSDNQLEFLKLPEILGSWYEFEALNNPLLKCIETDIPDEMNETFLSKKDVGTNFSSDCKKNPDPSLKAVTKPVKLAKRDINYHGTSYRLPKDWSVDEFGNQRYCDCEGVINGNIAVEEKEKLFMLVYTSAKPISEFADKIHLWEYVFKSDDRGEELTYNGIKFLKKKGSFYYDGKSEKAWQFVSIDTPGENQVHIVIYFWAKDELFNANENLYTKVMETIKRTKLQM